MSAKRDAKAWAALFRLPNLPTVPGDPLAGYLLAGMASGGVEPMPMVLCMLASLCLYGAGLLSNDYLDRTEDALARPSRPIPGGQVAAGVVAAVAALLALAGVLSSLAAGKAALAVALVLLLVLLAYNAGGKRIPVLGPLLMGSCRGLSLLLGAAACTGTWVLPAAPLSARLVLVLSAAPLAAALGLVLYIAAVTVVARQETESVRYGALRWAAPAVLGLALGIVLGLVWAGTGGGGIRAGLVAAFGAGLAGVAWGAGVAVRLAEARGTEAVGRAVGDLIRGVLLYQAALCFSVPGGWPAGIGLLALFPVSHGLARRIAAS